MNRQGPPEKDTGKAAAAPQTDPVKPKQESTFESWLREEERSPHSWIWQAFASAICLAVLLFMD
jgi:hypothetical protein